MTLSTLLLMRHAHAPLSNHDRPDHERPLNDEGRQDAKKVGNILRARRLMPDLIWSSDAIRTHETVACAFYGPDQPQAFFYDTLYHAPANAVLLFCEQKGEPDVKTLMLVGHNPGYEDLLYYFSDVPKRIPAGACAVLTRSDCNFKADPSDKPDIDTDMGAYWLLPDAWMLKSLIIPKDF